MTVSQPRRQMAGPALLTYRYIRLLLIAAVLAMLVSVALAWAAESQLRPSISAYYYSPARPILVGSLCAIGLALIGLRGRPGADDILLNVADLLAPVVAVVPTPVCPDGPPYGLADCAVGAVVPESFVADAVNGSWTLAIVVGFCLAYMTFVLRKRFGEREIAVGLSIVWAMYVPGVIGAVIFPDAYLQTAHYVAAVGLFICITVVAMLSARRVDRTRGLPSYGMSQTAYHRLYRVVAAVMTVTIVLGGLLMVLGVTGAVMLLIEVILLLTFAGYWIVATAETWRTGLPPDPPSPINPR